MNPALLLNTLTKPLRLLPDTVHSSIIARVCNHLMRGQGLEGRLLPLDGKSICIHVTDIPLSLNFTIRSGNLHRSYNDHWDARISGKSAEFWLLASRAEDPDTLFFNRRLSIEGDTETSLYIKNLLDALEFDWQAHFAHVTGRQPPQAMVRLADLIQAKIANFRSERSSSIS